MNRLPPVAVRVGVGFNPFTAMSQAMKATQKALMGPGVNRLPAPCPPGMVRAGNGQCVANFGGGTSGAATNVHQASPVRRGTGALPPIGVGLAPVALADPIGGMLRALITGMPIPNSNKPPHFPGANTVSRTPPRDLQELYVDNARLLNSRYSPSTGQIWAQRGKSAQYLGTAQAGVTIDGGANGGAGYPGNLPTGHLSNGARVRYYPINNGLSGGVWRQF